MIDRSTAERLGTLKKSPWQELSQESEVEVCDIHDDWLIDRDPRGKMFFYELGRHFERPVAVLIDARDEQLEAVFKELARQWKEETWFSSSIKKRIAHAAFLKIIGLGNAAIPFILEELRREPDYWSYALEAITREDPAPNAQNLRELRDAWLAWGKGHGY
jgi:hypothetical protein